MIKKLVFTASAFATILLFGSCSKNADVSPGKAEVDQSILQEKMAEEGNNPDDVIFSSTQRNNNDNHFYIESNKRSKNSILVFRQKQNGQLVLEDEVASGGYGSGEALGSQGAIAISRSNNLLFAVNAGSNSISSFRINSGTGALSLMFSISTNGQLPNSITVYENKLFVLNNLSSSICGFSFTSNGAMTAITGSGHNLSGMAVDAPQIKFAPDGKSLYVTEKATNLINKFTISNAGAVINAALIQSAGVTPFGFDYARNNRYVFVCNAANGFSGAGSATSYAFSNSGLTAVNGAVSNFESAPCWVATTKNGVYAFVANSASNNLSSYYIDQQGSLSLIAAVAAQDGKQPIDIAVSTDNSYVYTIYSGSHSIVAYKRMSAGAIAYTDKVTSLPKFAAGLAVY